MTQKETTPEWEKEFREKYCIPCQKGIAVLNNYDGITKFISSLLKKKEQEIRQKYKTDQWNKDIRESELLEREVT